jgi:UDP-glucose 6-dehydrogenase
MIFIAVPTPPEKDGSVNLDFIEQVAREDRGSYPRRSLPHYRR